jgi:hypothetical protein
MRGRYEERGGRGLTKNPAIYGTQTVHSDTSKKIVSFPLLALFDNAISTDVNTRVISSVLWSDYSDSGTVTKQVSVTFSMKFSLDGNCENM